MLFTTAYAKSLCLLSILSVAAGGPVSARDDDVTVILGEPELFPPSETTVDVKGNVVKLAEVENAERDLEAESAGLQIRANADQIAALNLHNSVRARHGVPNLVWDNNLENAARAYAETLARKGALEHSDASTRPDQGENLGWIGSSAPIPNPIALAAEGWLNEEGNYHNELVPQGNFQKYGHYTQAVWRSSVRVGIATVTDGRGAYYTVGRYSPPGNWVGQRPY